MNLIEPGIRNLATAKDVLLTPYGLDESRLTRIDEVRRSLPAWRHRVLA